jgi:hypothetical protein
MKRVAVAVAVMCGAVSAARAGAPNELMAIDYPTAVAPQLAFQPPSATASSMDALMAPAPDRMDMPTSKVESGALLWSSRALFAAANVALLADWRQTQWMTSHRPMREGEPGCDEKNPLLGRTPGAAYVATYFASAMALAVVAYAKLPRWSHPLIFGAITAVEAYALGNNHHAGATAPAGAQCSGIPW